jgi:hypothetical protein
VRGIGARRPLPEGVAARLRGLAAAGGGDLLVLDDPKALHDVGEVLARGDRLRFLSPAMHRELYGELRWDGAAAGGLDVRTLELDATEAAGLQLTADPEVVQTVAAVGGGQGLGRLALVLGEDQRRPVPTRFGWLPRLRHQQAVVGGGGGGRIDPEQGYATPCDRRAAGRP